jgi:hypothetical protein
MQWMGYLVAAWVMTACGRSSEPAPSPAPPAPPVAAAPAPGTAPTPAAAPPDSAQPPTKTDEDTTTAAVAADVENPAPKVSKGRIKLHHSKPKKESLRELADELQKSRLFADIMGELEKLLVLPQDLSVHFEDCGEINAFYDPEKKRISMCWELLEYTAEQFSKDGANDEEAAAGFVSATIFTFFHELGHALVDLLDLPITGKEEDVVDQLATWILVAGGEEGALMAIDGAVSFVSDDSDGGDEEPVTWGEHSLDQQRFYNIVCWVYGSDPTKFAELTESRDGPLPNERAEICPDEWARMSKAWERLLADHVRE